MLRDYLTVCPNGFARDPHPRPFDDLCSPSQEPSARAGQGMVAEDVDEPAASGRGAAPLWTEGEWEAQTATQGKLHCLRGKTVSSFLCWYHAKFCKRNAGFVMLPSRIPNLL